MAARQSGTADPSGSPVSASRYILRSRLLRGVFVSLVISGIGISVTIPQITLFLVGELHLSTAQAGLYFLTNLTAPIAGYLVGSLSDRAGSRLLVFRLSALAGFVGLSEFRFACGSKSIDLNPPPHVGCSGVGFWIRSELP